MIVPLATAALLAANVATADLSATTLSSAAWVDSTMSHLTVREKVAQMVMPWLPGGLPARESAEWKKAQKLVEEEKVGGVIVGKGAARGTAQWLNELQRRASVPLLVGADLEWGPGMRLEGATLFPVNMAIAATGKIGYAYEAGRITALEARAAGVHVVFAPVADVNVNPRNPVINTRSYGADPAAVAERVAAFVAGAREGGALTVAKHFPGHGDVDQDSHLTLPTLSASRSRMDEVELIPFRAAIGAGVDGVMTAHLSVPALEKAGTPTRPATLSSAVLTGVLRDELGFGGLVVTDGLNMDGVRKGRSPGEVAVEAVQAGADILLMPPAVGEAIDAVVAAVDAGTVALSRIEASVRRILLAKAAAGLDRERLTDPKRWPTALGAAEHQAWAERVAGESITLVRQGPAGLPRIAGRRVLSLVYDDAVRSAAGEAFQKELEKQGAKVTTVRLSRQSKAAALKDAERAAASAEVVVFSSYARGSSPERGGVTVPEAVGSLANRLAAKGAVVFSFGDPYLLRQLPRTRHYLLAWSEVDAAQRAAARALAGAQTIVGRLPIPLPPTHALGEGITLPALASRPGGAPDPAATIR